MQKTVFVADNNPVLLATLRHVLEARTEFRVCGTARNGKDAIERAVELHPDVIVLDLSLPVVDGLEAAQSIKRAMPEVPIVLFTVHNTRLVCAEAVCCGIDAIASKIEGLAGLIAKLNGLPHR